MVISKIRQKLFLTVFTRCHPGRTKTHKYTEILSLIIPTFIFTPTNTARYIVFYVFKYIVKLPIQHTLNSYNKTTKKKCM